MPNSSDFDPAEAIDFDQDKARQRVRQEQAAEEAAKQCKEAEKQRAQAQRRANLLKLLRYADEQLENIRNPIVSEFVITERWYSETGFFRKRIRRSQRETRYYGSWLLLQTAFRSPSSNWDNPDSGLNVKTGLVKLRQPCAGYAYVEDIDDCDPRNVANIFLDLNFLLGPDYRPVISEKHPDPTRRRGLFQIHESLEEATESIKLASTESWVEALTKRVTQALDFVATGQRPAPVEWLMY